MANIKADDPLYPRLRAYLDHPVGTPDPLAVDNGAFMMKRIGELQRTQINVESENAEIRMLADNRARGMNAIYQALLCEEAVATARLELLRMAYAPLRNQHVKTHRLVKDVSYRSASGPGVYCPTCDVLTRMQTEIERGSK